MRVLAIETSCDETAIAIADFERAKSGIRVRVLSHQIASQVKLHAKFGGVVPNLARREHEKNLVPLLSAALAEADLPEKMQKTAPAGNTSIHRCIEAERMLAREAVLARKFQKVILPLPAPDIDAIAVTYGPGLAPALWTGVNFARALAYLWEKPLIGTNHMAGHLFSAVLQHRGESSKFKVQNLKFPVLALLVSGGHTELVLVKKPWRFQIIGETRDDAVGEAFDKVARILGLKYPGGPEIARLADRGSPKAYALPRPMLHTHDYDFSFSGLKTAVLYLVRDLGKLNQKKKQDVAASFQKAAVEVLVQKTLRAAKEHKIKTLAIGGGVAANAMLRRELSGAVKHESSKTKFLLPDASLTGDNALMIAAAAYFSGKKFGPETNLRVDANARLC